MKHTQSNNNGTNRHMHMLAIFLVPAVALILGATAPDCWAENGELDVAELFFELNNTDRDLGIHALVDGDGWREFEIETPNGREILNVRARSRLARQGITELFFESAEPSFDELPPRRFFRRFPAGDYEFEVETIDGEELEGIATLTHVMPAPAANITINGENALPAGGEECEEKDLPEVSGDVTVAWYPVTSSHPEIGEDDPDIEIIRYQIVAEWEDEDGNAFVSSIDLPPSDDDSMSVTISANFFRPGEVKFEVLVREASYNQTAVESCPFEYVVVE